MQQAALIDPHQRAFVSLFLFDNEKCVKAEPYPDFLTILRTYQDVCACIKHQEQMRSCVLRDGAIMTTLLKELSSLFALIPVISHIQRKSTFIPAWLMITSRLYPELRFYNIDTGSSDLSL